LKSDLKNAHRVQGELHCGVGCRMNRKRANRRLCFRVRKRKDSRAGRRSCTTRHRISTLAFLATILHGMAALRLRFGWRRFRKDAEEARSDQRKERQASNQPTAHEANSITVTPWEAYQSTRSGPKRWKGFCPNHACLFGNLRQARMSHPPTVLTHTLMSERASFRADMRVAAVSRFLCLPDCSPLRNSRNCLTLGSPGSMTGQPTTVRN
jgi:hypothetical protein